MRNLLFFSLIMVLSSNAVYSDNGNNMPPGTQQGVPEILQNPDGSNGPEQLMNMNNIKDNPMEPPSYGDFPGDSPPPPPMQQSAPLPPVSGTTNNGPSDPSLKINPSPEQPVDDASEDLDDYDLEKFTDDSEEDIATNDTEEAADEESEGYSQSITLMEMYQTFEIGSEHIQVPEINIGEKCQEKSSDFEKIDCLLEDFATFDDFINVVTNAKFNFEELSFDDSSTKIKNTYELAELIAVKDVSAGLSKTEFMQQVFPATVIQQLDDMPKEARDIFDDNFNNYTSLLEKTLVKTLTEVYAKEFMNKMSSTEINELLATQKKIADLQKGDVYTKQAKVFVGLEKSKNYITSLNNQGQVLTQFLNQTKSEFQDKLILDLTNAGYSDVVTKINMR